MLFRKTLYLVALATGLLLNSTEVQAQCCSAGSPAGVGAYAGLVAQRTLRVTTFGRYTHSAHYYQGDSRIDRPLVVKNSNFIFQGVNVSYGLIKGLALDLDLGYFYLKDQSFENGYYLKGYGLSNGVFMLKKNLLHIDTSGFDLSAGLGMKFPFRLHPMFVDNVELPVDLQPSTQAFGITAQLFLKKNLIPYRLSLYFINRYEYNFKNQDLYRFGDRLRSSLVLEANLTRRLGTMLQTRFEYAGYDYDFRQGDVFHHSGSYLIFISPLIVYSIASLWHVSLSADLPVYKYYNGTQLANQYSFALNLTRDFSFKKRK